MTIQLDTTTRNARGDAITSSLGANALMRIYDGTPPANVGAALSGNNLLVELPCSAVFAPATSGGTLTANPITTTNAAMSGTPSFFRLVTSGGVARVQGTVGVSGGGGVDAIISHSPITAGDPIAASIALTEPGA